MGLPSGSAAGALGCSADVIAASTVSATFSTGSVDSIVSTASALATASSSSSFFTSSELNLRWKVNVETAGLAGSRARVLRKRVVGLGADRNGREAMETARRAARVKTCLYWD